MGIPWKVVGSGFLDGFGAFILMFKPVRVPGSPSEELNRLTTPAALAKYSAANPNLADAILGWKAEALARDRAYARLTRVLGSIQLTAIILAACYLAFHYLSR